MFERTMSFWKRLLGRHPAAEDGASVKQAEEDRRVWVRYPADLPTTYQPASKEETVRLTARVRNVSLGGVSLAVDRPFQPGEMLSVELPGATDESRCKVLACVVHLTPVGGLRRAPRAPFLHGSTHLDAIYLRREGPVSADWRPRDGAAKCQGDQSVRERRRPSRAPFYRQWRSAECRIAGRQRILQANHAGLRRSRHRPARERMGAGLQLHSLAERRGFASVVVRCGLKTPPPTPLLSGEGLGEGFSNRFLAIPRARERFTQFCFDIPPRPDILTSAPQIR